MERRRVLTASSDARLGHSFRRIDADERSIAQDRQPARNVEHFREAVADENDGEFFGHLALEQRAAMERVLKDIVERRGLSSVPVG